jgi:hypothetical protein
MGIITLKPTVMNLRLKFLGIIIALSSMVGLFAQPGNFGEPILPLQPNGSPLFGKDIVIHDQPDRDQRNIAVCSAFNGWLYAAYSYSQPHQGYISVLRSIDNGISWNVIGGGGATIFGNKIITNLGIIACGNSLSNIKLFMGWVFNDTVLNFWGAYVARYNPEPFTVEGEILNETGGIKDLVLSSDYNYPALNSNPYSIAVLYSKSGVKDSIIFRSSSNGGLSLDNRRTVATTWNYFHKVSLNYGRSPSWSSGRYFAAWEEQIDQYSNLGHIYTAHSDPDFNSPFTNPVCLDSIDPAIINKVRNPVLACQYSNVDNDSTNLSEVIVFEKYLSSNNRYDLKGFYNLQSVTSDYFSELSISPSTDNKIQPDVNFNPYNSTFMITYFDSTEKKLPFLSNNMNLQEPDNWNIINAAYNDSINIYFPKPKVKINITNQDGMNVWNAERNNGNGMAMFDAPYSIYNIISELNKIEKERLFGAYPNPCSNYLNIWFQLGKTDKVTITLYSLLGKLLGIFTSPEFPKGSHQIKLNVSEFSQGSYTYSIRIGEYLGSGKIIIIK